MNVGKYKKKTLFTTQCQIVTINGWVAVWIRSVPKGPCVRIFVLSEGLWVAV